MAIEKWLSDNCASLKGKTVAITGSTGGLGKELCRYLCQLGADLVMINRSLERSNELKAELQEKYHSNISVVVCDFSCIESVKSAAKILKEFPIDIFISNAGAYSIKREIGTDGICNIFKINFLSPYYLIKELLPLLRERKGRVVAVSSIAHIYSKTDPSNIDFKDKKSDAICYGNSKRYLMFSLYKLFENEKDVTLSITHPGITFTNITAHYPPIIFKLIKYPMKIIFMKPKKACLSVLKGVFEKTKSNQWIGPWLFDVWGMPKLKKVNTCIDKEQDRIFKTAEELYKKANA